jgi:hypothetical protein
MADLPQYAAFAENLNTMFRVYLDDGNTIDLKLIEVSDRLVSPGQERFAILFSGPNESFLDQGGRRLAHDQLGEFELFLVPVSKDDQGTNYEAVFNRIPTND